MGYDKNIPSKLERFGLLCLSTFQKKHKDKLTSEGTVTKERGLSGLLIVPFTVGSVYESLIKKW